MFRKKQKGGTLIGAHKSLDPILIEEYSEEFELLVIEEKLEEGTKELYQDTGLKKIGIKMKEQFF